MVTQKERATVKLKLISAGLLLAGFLAAEPPPAQKQDWERMKACAAQAEKAIQAWRAEENGLSTVQLLANHYSAKDERCYMEAKVVDAGGVMYALRDAFEKQNMADHVWFFKEQPLIGRQLCQIGDDSKDCTVVDRYFDERLKN